MTDPLCTVSTTFFHLLHGPKELFLTSYTVVYKKQGKIPEEKMTLKTFLHTLPIFREFL